MTDSHTLAFAMITAFFLLVHVLELAYGESIGVPAKRELQPSKYWSVLLAQAIPGIIFAALIYALKP